MKRMLVVAGALVLSVGAVVAQQNVANETQTAMKATGRALGAVLSPMVKGEKPYDQAAVDTALSQLETTAKKLPTMFPESIKGVKIEGDYSSSPKIWEDKAGFAAKTEINRKEFNVNFNAPMEGGGVVVGDKITIGLDIEADLAK